MRAGISGHQDLGEGSNVDWLQTHLVDDVPWAQIVSGVTSLAIGADQLFAKTVIEQSKQLEVVLPCYGYEATFSKSADLTNFILLKREAVKVRTLQFESPSEEAFFEAGRHIVNMSELMIFIWNGLPAKGKGGTADIVAYATSLGRQYIHFNPFARCVKRSGGLRQN